MSKGLVKLAPHAAIAAWAIATASACADSSAGDGAGGADTTSSTGASSTAVTASASGATTASSGTASASSSASTGTGGFPGQCGNELCRVDQTCHAGACEFDCTGATVPGDYATVKDAIMAKESVPNSTICLAAATYDEEPLVIVSDHLTIIGKSAAATTIASPSAITTRGTLTLEGVTVDAKLTADGWGSDTTAIGARFTKGIDVVRDPMTPNGQAGATVHLDGCDVAGGVFAYDPSGFSPSLGGITLDLANSWFHDAPSCVRAYLGGSSPTPSLTVHLVGDTIRGCDKGVDVSVLAMGSATALTTIDLFDDIVADSATVGIALDLSGAISGSSVTTGHDALFGNTTNYAGSAMDGPGYVKSDCLLDASTPPRPGPGSPCIDAGDPANGSPHDFYGQPRSATHDVGAVEVP